MFHERQVGVVVAGWLCRHGAHSRGAGALVQNKAGEVVKFQGNDNAFMEFFQTDPEMGTHLVARLKSSGGYKADGMHYFAAHRYLLPGTFTVRFGAGTRTSRKHGNLRAVSYTTLVKDPELELLEAERRRIVEMQRHELSARDQRFIKSLKPTAMLSDTACADVAASLNKSTEAVKVGWLLLRYVTGTLHLS